MTPARDVRAGRHVLAVSQRTFVMGVVNVTPDSFSGDGTGDDLDAAVALALRMQQEGADIVDVGGESTRPDAVPVDAEVEAARVVPVIEALARKMTIPVSVDTKKATVAERAIRAGASVVNDVWGLRGDPAMAPVVAASDAALVVMHNRTKTVSTDVVQDALAALHESLEIARSAGIDPERIIVDPGFGFAKTPAQNLEVVRHLTALHTLNRPILCGVSRKSTIGFLTGQSIPSDRVDGGIALAALLVAAGASIIRTHDVAPTVRALRVVDAVVRGTPASIEALAAPGQTG
jgi:dihydropteroate synthase